MWRLTGVGGKALECVVKLTGGFGKDIRRVCGCCLTGVGRPIGVCGKAFYRVWEGCLSGVGRLS